jgi:hypothetical protein
MLLDEMRDAFERRDMLIFPNPEIGGSDASFCIYRGCVRNDQTRAPNCPATEMNEVPVVGESIFGRVLAHG